MLQLLKHLVCDKGRVAEVGVRFKPADSCFLQAGIRHRRDILYVL